MRTNIPNTYDTRLVKKFFLFPRTVLNVDLNIEQRIWLESVWVIQEFYGHQTNAWRTTGITDNPEEYKNEVDIPPKPPSDE